MTIDELNHILAVLKNVKNSEYVYEVMMIDEVSEAIRLIENEIELKENNG